MIQQLKAYKNEILLLLSIVLLLLAIAYKQHQVTAAHNGTKSAALELQDLKEIIELKKVWGGKKIAQKVDRLQKLVPPSKVKWSKKGKKLTASFSNLTPQELNRLINKILNLPVEIQKLNMEKQGTSYKVELKCKW